jgi:hypothetical protein
MASQLGNRPGNPVRIVPVGRLDGLTTPVPQPGADPCYTTRNILNDAEGSAMRRITIQVSDDAHKALKLLGIEEAKPFGTVVLDAIEFYLQHKRAYDLDVARSSGGG